MKTLFEVISVCVAVLGLFVQGSLAADAKGLPKKISIDLGGDVKMELVLIRPGSFKMGSEKEKPIHKVTISKPFYIGKFEVTQEQWKAVMWTSPSYFSGAKSPVERVSWDDCQAFLKKLNKLKKGSGYTFRLPTEAEWEYACRAGTSTKYYYGENDAGLSGYAWFGNNSGNTTHPVGTKKPNAWGLYDMHGNVWEWCQDWKGEYAGAEEKDPVGPAKGSYRVMRGGSWPDIPLQCRSAHRGDFFPSVSFNNCGFRVVGVADVETER